MVLGIRYYITPQKVNFGFRLPPNGFKYLGLESVFLIYQKIVSGILVLGLQYGFWYKEKMVLGIRSIGHWGVFWY